VDWGGEATTKREESEIFRGCQKSIWGGHVLLKQYSYRKRKGKKGEKISLRKSQGEIRKKKAMQGKTKGLKFKGAKG